MTEQEKLNQLQLIEQNLQQFLLQKQQFQAQLMEIDSALGELKTTKKAYKIVGNIMVASDKESLEKDLKQKKETTELRIKTLEKQEEKLKEKAKALREEVMKTIKK